MSEQTNNRIAEIRARIAAATPGPWGVHYQGNTEQIRLSAGDYLNGDGWSVWQMWPYTADAEFAAHAPEDIKFLLNEIGVLENQLGNASDELERVHADLVDIERQRDECAARVAQCCIALTHALEWIEQGQNIGPKPILTLIKDAIKGV